MNTTAQSIRPPRFCSGEQIVITTKSRRELGELGQVQRQRGRIEDRAVRGIPPHVAAFFFFYSHLTPIMRYYPEYIPPP